MQSQYFRDFVSGYYSNRNPLTAPIDRGEESAIAGRNTIHTDRSTFAKRPGLTKWSTIPVPADDTPLQIVDYTDIDEQHVVVDGSKTIKEYTASTVTTLFTKLVSGVLAHMVAASGILYASSTIAGGVRHKRIGSDAFKAWGIDRPTVAPTVADIGLGATIVINHKYRYVYKDSEDGHISSASPPSVAIGPIGDANIRVTVTGTTQARVDKIDIYRTKDGGSTYFYLTTLNNPGTATTITYDDIISDDNLDVFLICPSEVSNARPPVGLHDLVAHVSRIWGIKDNTVRASSHPIDGLINGVAEECWPVILTFKFDSPVFLVSTLDGLLVYTRNGDVFLISGRSVFDFDPNLIYTKLPINSRRAVTQDGNIIYLHTSTGEFLRISDRLENFGVALSKEDLTEFDPSTTHIACHREGTRSAFFASATNRIFRFSVTNGTWSPVWRFEGTTVSTRLIKSVQTELGIFRLIVAPRLNFDGFLWFLDEEATTDDGIEFSPFVQFGSFVLTDPGKITALNSIVTEASRQPTVSLLLQEVSGTPGGVMEVQSEPPLLTQPTTFASHRHYINRSTFPSACRHFQVRLTWPTDDETDELYGLGFIFDDPQ